MSLNRWVVVSFLTAVGVLLAGPQLQAQTGVLPPDLVYDSSPVDTDVFPVWKIGESRAKRTNRGDLRSGLTPTSRTITCTAPLLCAGGTSMDLSADRTLSFYGPNTHTRNVTCSNNSTTDSAAISSALSALQSSGGGVLHLTGTSPLNICSVNARIINDQPVGTFSPLLIEGDGINATRISFTSGACTGGSCIYFRCNINIGSGYCDGSGVRDLSIYLSTGQTGIEIAGLENPIISNLFVNGGDTQIKIGESRGGTATDLWLTQFTGYGILFTGESTISTDLRHVTLVANNATSCVAYHKLTSSVVDGILLTRVACNGTTTGPAFDFTSTTHEPLYLWLTDVVADGTFGTAGVRVQNFDKLFFSQLWSITHGSNASGLILDNTDQVQITGGELWAGNGASASDLKLLNSVNAVTLTGTQLTGGILGVYVDSTSHDAYLSPGWIYGSAQINDPTKVVLTTKRMSAPRTFYTGSGALNMVGLIDPAGSSSVYLDADSSGVFHFYANNGTSALMALTQAGNATFTGQVLGTTFGAGTSSPDSLLTATANASALPSPISGSLFHLAAADSSGTIGTWDSFGAADTLAFRRANGTNVSKSAAASGDVIGNIASYGYGTTGYGSTPFAAIRTDADEAFSDTAQGGRIEFHTNNLTTTALTKRLTIDGKGHLVYAGTAPTVACTGTGTSPSAPTLGTGSTDERFMVTVNTGTSPANTGTCTVTFAQAFVTNNPVIVCMLVSGASTWGSTATIQLTTESLSAPVFTWTNSVAGTLTALTGSSSYKFACHVDGK